MAGTGAVDEPALARIAAARAQARAAPAPILLAAVIGTQAIATLIAVYGLLMTPLGWGWAAVVWAYALLWFLVEDRVKLAAHHSLDHRRSPEPATSPPIQPLAT